MSTPATPHPATPGWRSPSDLADLLDDTCKDLQVPLGLDREALRAAAIETYRLSLLRDESRELRPQVCVLPSNNIGRVAVQFSEFMPFEADRIHKIAPSTPRGPFAFLVRATGAKLEAVGWLRIADHRLGTGADPEATGSRYEGGAWFRVVGPGAIEAWSSHLMKGRGEAAAAFRDGGCFRLTGGTIDVVCFSFEHAAAVLGLTQKPTHALLRVIPLAQQARHGGAYVLLPSGADVAKVLAEETGLFRSMCRLTTPATGSLISYAENEPPDAQRLQWLVDEVRCLADLSASDGCVVLARPLQAVAFAAQIAAEVSGAIPGEEMGPVESGPVDLSRLAGTRHGSAARLCHRLPRTIAIVVSQDGGVTLFCSPEKKAVMRFGPFFHIPTFQFYGATE